MFDCYAMINCSKPASSKDIVIGKEDESVWIKCNDIDFVQDLIDEDYGCCNCGTQHDLEFVEIDKDSVWLQCAQCAHESFCESCDCARNDNYGEE